MQILKQIYRANYAGENVITRLVKERGEWHPTVEFVPNQVINTHSTDQAVVLGQGETLSDFDLRFLKDHAGGLLATNRLQSYGINEIYETFEPDFLIVDGDLSVANIANSGYTNDHIVYTKAKYVLNYPGKFYLIPQSVGFDPNALAVYMACFDGHKRVYMLGFDEYTHPDLDMHDEFKVQTLPLIMATYPDVDFVRVNEYATTSCHDNLISRPNFRQISHRDFVLEADIGALKTESV